MKMNFLIDNGREGTIPSGEFQTRFLDLSQVASIANRRFYRQGLNWAVAGMQIRSAPLVAPADNSYVPKINILVQKLPNTWVMSNAWEKSFRAWQKMNREALAETPSIKPKFLDFKIYADKFHHEQKFDKNLLPRSFEYDSTNQAFTVNTAKPGEWVASKVSIPVTTPAGSIDVGETSEFEFIAVGANYPGTNGDHNAVSLIEGYASSRGLPYTEDPNAPGDAMDTGGATPENWISAMFNEGTNVDRNVLDDMITENNQAPYPFEGMDLLTTDTQYPGGANQLPGLELHDALEVTSTTIGSITNIPGGNFPCGLIAFTIGNDTANAITVSLQLTLVPGNHRGYLAESMTEM